MADELLAIAARLESASDPAWLWDVTRRRIFWANAKGRVFWGAASLFDLAERVFPADGPDARAMDRTGASVEGTLSSPAGPIRAQLAVTRVRAAPLDDGRLVRVRALSRQAVRLGEAARAELFAAAPVGLCLMDGEGTRIQSNRAWESLAGAGGARLETLVGEKAAARFLIACVSHGQGQVSATTGTKRLRLTGKRLKRAADAAPMILVRGDDVTVSHALEMLLSHRAAGPAVETSASAQTDGPHEDLAAALAAERRRSEAKSDFIAKLSHEMRTPLNAIMGFSEIMEQGRFGPLGDSRYETYAADIRTSAEHLLSLVNDLLDLARIESGHLKLEFDGVALPALIEQCVRLLRPQADGYGVTVQVMVPANLPPVVADTRSLKQVLLNLLSNAIKFSGEGGTVNVTAELTGDGGVVIAVSDTGVGMSRGEVQLALEPFGQIDGALQAERQGTGLGLPVAKALTEANKATFSIESEPQHGTRVNVAFPPTRVLAG